MKRWLPSPLLSAGLLLVWLLLAKSLEPAQILLGLLLALLLPHFVRPLHPQAGPMRNVWMLLRLIMSVGKDVVISALEVAVGILRAPWREPRGCFVAVPLELRDQHALAALAMISAVIPGTVWSELAPDRSTVHIHVFNLEDEVKFINHFKTRYEKPLQEIFQ